MVENREPVLATSPAVVLSDQKLDAGEEPRSEAALNDFAFSAELVRLMSLFDRIEDGKIAKIEIRAGIPRRITVERLVSECLSSPYALEQKGL